MDQATGVLLKPVTVNCSGPCSAAFQISARRGVEPALSTHLRRSPDANPAGRSATERRELLGRGHVPDRHRRTLSRVGKVVAIVERSQAAAAIRHVERDALTASKQREHTIDGRDTVQLATLTR